MDVDAHGYQLLTFLSKSRYSFCFRREWNELGVMGDPDE